MGFFDRFRGKGAGGRPVYDTAHLESWARERHGVEAYVEPKTAVTETTVVLIAHDGEWTRRRISAPADAYRLGQKLGIPVYDTNLMGYPQRMRDYTARQNALRKRGEA
ncbi:oxidoreductase [Pseudonocardiaceae bacterium YIM PH 21723]|nr:oxidoreductase [Pseudonocardiaceae bacterium YIM PH 21723]